MRELSGDTHHVSQALSVTQDVLQYSHKVEVRQRLLHASDEAALIWRDAGTLLVEGWDVGAGISELRAPHQSSTDLQPRLVLVENQGTRLLYVFVASITLAENAGEVELEGTHTYGTFGHLHVNYNEYNV